MGTGAQDRVLVCPCSTQSANSQHGFSADSNSALYETILWCPLVLGFRILEHLLKYQAIVSGNDGLVYGPAPISLLMLDLVLASGGVNLQITNREGTRSFLSRIAASALMFGFGIFFRQISNVLIASSPCGSR